MGTLSDTAAVLRQLDSSQRVIEYALAVVIPTVLAVMMFSYFAIPELFQLAFFAAVGAALFTMVPAYKALQLHYLCWAKNTMPQRIITGLVGMIYISVVSVFCVSLVSASQGFDPQQPTTFAVFAALLLGLIALMAYSSRYKERYEQMDIRYFRVDPSSLENDVKALLAESGEEYRAENKGRRAVLVLEKRKVIVTIASQPRRTSEVIIECAELSSTGLCENLKRELDRRT